MSVLHPKTVKDFQRLVAQYPLVFVKWSTAWCGPCKQIQPFYETLAKENTTEEIVFVSILADEEEFRALALENNVISVPTFQVYLDHKLEGNLLGASKASLKSLVAKYVE